MLAIAMQVLLPASLAVAKVSGVDVSQYYCAPSGSLTPQSRAMAEQLAKILGENLPDETSGDGHCPFCTLAHSAPLPAVTTLAAPAIYSHTHVFVRYTPGLVRKAQGPPLGSRGPPSHI